MKEREQTKNPIRINKKRVLALIMFAALLIPLLTGCGMRSPHTSDTNLGNLPSKSTSGDNGDNRLCSVQDDKAYGACGDNGETSGHNCYHSRNGIWTVMLDANKAYGLNASEDGFVLLRNIAVLMYDSVFFADPYMYKPDGNGGYVHIDGRYDYFMSDSFGGIDLSPVSVTQNTIEILSEKMGLDDLKDETNTAMAPMRSVLTFAKGISAAVLIAVWAMGFISQVVNEKFTMETLLKTLMQLMCGIVVITNADVLVSAFAHVGDEFITNFSATGASVFPELSEQIREKILIEEAILALNIALGFPAINLSFAVGTIWIDIGCLVAILYLAAPFFIVLMCAYKIISAMVTRYFELLIRIILAPIPLAFGAQNGFSQDTIRFLRSTMACALHPVLILVGAVAVGAVGDVVCNIFGSTQNTVTGLLGIICISLTYLIFNAYIGQTKQLAQEIIAR